MPIILKTFVITYANNQTEFNLYEKAFPFLQDFLPQIYHIEHNASRYNGKPVTWVFMEQLRPLHKQFKLKPHYYFDHVVPALAKLHAHAYEERFDQQQDVFTPWFPPFNSPEGRKRRRHYIEQNLANIDAALKSRHTRAIIKPYHSQLKKILQRGPGFFPELETCRGIIHGDLHEKNICCNDINADEWEIRYIDWEGAEFAPVWYDVSQQIDVLIDYRDDWHAQEAELRDHYVALYVSEMNKHGITFRTDPLKLYKMGYLQAMLERGLYYELESANKGSSDSLLKRYMQKLDTWGKELGLYK